MYRKLILLLLCAGVVTSAPQQNSNITYIKRQLDLEYSPPDLKPSERESRIEKIPLTIPGNIGNQDKQTIINVNNSSETVKNVHTNDSQPIYNYSDRIYSIKTKPKKNNTSAEQSTPSSSNEEVNNSNDILETTDSEIVPAESILSDRVVKNENKELNSEVDATQSDEFVTEKYEEEPTVTTEVAEDITKAPIPILRPKLSYFEKPTIGSFSQNLIATSGKRGFRSHCRCEKIWNCAKLQISVARCPDEYFLCCS